MIAIRVRSIERSRRSHCCEDCEREIPRGDGCVEVSRYEPGRVWSEYTCCRTPWSIKRARRW